MTNNRTWAGYLALGIILIAFVSLSAAVVNAKPNPRCAATIMGVKVRSHYDTLRARQRVELENVTPQSLPALVEEQRKERAVEGYRMRLVIQAALEIDNKLGCPTQ